jgi:hypothetical protein
MLIQSPNLRRGTDDERRQIPAFPYKHDTVFPHQSHGEAAFVDGLLGMGQLADEAFGREGEGVVDFHDATTASARPFDSGVGGGERMEQANDEEEDEKEDTAWWPS